MNKWHKIHEMSWPERRLVLLALILLPSMALTLRLLGLRRSQAVWTRLAFNPRPPADLSDAATVEGEARATARMVKAAASHGPYRATCLRQSLALWWLLRLQGIDGLLHIGVRKADNATMEAHAWVELGGQPLNDREDVRLRYAPFARTIAPAGMPLS
jgi:hypothetical protein